MTTVTRWRDVFSPNDYMPRDVVGEASHMPQIMSVVGGEVQASQSKRYHRDVEFERSRHYPALLAREVNNPYDRNAVAVVVAGQRVGYLARGDAAIIAPRMDAAGVPSITASVWFSWKIRDYTGKRLQLRDLKIGVKFSDYAQQPRTVDTWGRWAIALGVISLILGTGIYLAIPAALVALKARSLPMKIVAWALASVGILLWLYTLTSGSVVR